MHRIMSLFFLLMIFFVASVLQARECPSREVLAQEIIKAELSGWRNAMNNQTCLEKSEFPSLDVGTGVGYDSEEYSNPLLLDNEKQVQIKKVMFENGRVRVEFDIINGKKHIKDHLYYIETEAQLTDKFGCAILEEAPKTVFLLKKCFDSNSTK